MWNPDDLTRKERLTQPLDSLEDMWNEGLTNEGSDGVFVDPAYICDFCGHVSCRGDCEASYDAMWDREEDDRSEWDE